MRTILFGVEHFLTENDQRTPLKGARYGLLLNQASVDHNFE